MQTIIQQKYKAFVRSYQSMPKVAKVVIEWNDNHQQHEYLISLDDYWIDEFSYPYRHTKWDVSQKKIYSIMQVIYRVCTNL